MKIVGIYKITSPSGRIYIGQSIDIYDRWKDYKCLNCKSQIKLYNSFNKYTLNNHTFEIIEECEDSELNNRERYYQEFYDCIEKGLNCKYQESDDKSGKWSEEVKEKMRNSSIGKKHTEETKLKLSIIVKEHFKKNSHPNSKKVIDTETGEIYESCSELARILNIVQTTLSRQLNGSRKRNKTKYKYL